MRDDQRERLKDVTERLAEVVIADVDPNNWTASGVLLCDMDRDQRGDAKWCRQTAVQSLALLTRMEHLQRDFGGDGGGSDEPDPESDIRRAEKAASDALRRLGITD